MGGAHHETLSRLFTLMSGTKSKKKWEAKRWSNLVGPCIFPWWKSGSPTKKSGWSSGAKFGRLGLPGYSTYSIVECISIGLVKKMCFGLVIYYFNQIPSGQQHLLHTLKSSKHCTVQSLWKTAWFSTPHRVATLCSDQFSRENGHPNSSFQLGQEMLLWLISWYLENSRCYSCPSAGNP